MSENPIATNLTNLLSTQNTVTRLMDDEEDVGMCFLEVSQAFDVVNHRFLCVKVGLGSTWLTTHFRSASEMRYSRKMHSPVVFFSAK